ncbi:hypothetical protein HBF32_05775 [Luteibacter yeojuensis]|uniref:Uncharacterized protein n=1 Tax=Luteibacter yeojuensis TaxID=345309 RepID=A0A7X5TPE5_9GAMM|nr:hypothetical protein [Luteibacter yeojuensis]
MDGRATEPPVIVSDPCSAWKPIYVSTKDVLTDATAKAILDHNVTGAKLCGWKPRTTSKK